MVFSNTWDETVPAGSEVRSLGDNRIRELKVGVRERISVEHLVGDNTDSPFGMHAYDVKTKTSADSPYTITTLDNIVRLNAAGGNIAVILPTAIGYDGKVFTLDKISNTNIVTITCNGAETIGGYTTYKMKEAKRIYIISNGANWSIFNVDGEDTKQSVGVKGRGYENLVVKTNSAYSGLITADWARLVGSQGDVIRHSTISATFNITVSGAGGLRSGLSEGANVWYYIFLISDGASPTGYLDTSTTPTLPAGYTHYALIGAVRNKSDSNFQTFGQYDNYVIVDYSGGTLVDAGTATSATDVDLTTTAVSDTVAAPNALRVEVGYELTYVTGGGYLTLQTNQAGFIYSRKEIGNVNANLTSQRSSIWMVPYLGIIQYFNSTGNFTTALRVNGWEY